MRRLHVVLLSNGPDTDQRTLAALASQSLGTDGFTLQHVGAASDAHYPDGLIVQSEAADASCITFLRGGSTPDAGYLERLSSGAGDRLVIGWSRDGQPPVEVAPTDAVRELRALDGLTFPAEWLDGMTVPLADDATRERVFIARALEPYHRQVMPAAFVKVSEGWRAQVRPLAVHSIEDVASALAEMTGGSASHPDERGPLTRQLVADFVESLPSSLLATDAARDLLARGLKVAGVQDIDVTEPGNPWPTLGSFIDDDLPPIPQFTVICADARQLASERGVFGLLRLAGGGVRAAAFREDPDPKLKIEFRRIADGPDAVGASPFAKARAFAARAERGVRRRALRVVLSPRLLPPTVFRDPAIADESLARWAKDTVVIALDEFGRKAAVASGLEVAPLEQLDAWIVAAVARRTSVTLGQSRTLRRSLKRLQRSRTNITLPSHEVFHLAAYRVALSGRFEAARAVVSACSALHPRSKNDPERSLLEVLIKTGSELAVPAGAETLIGETLRRAETELASDEQRRLFILQIAIHIIFHPDAQTVVPKPSLFHGPGTLVDALDNSSLWHRISPTKLPQPVDASGDPNHAKVLLLRGSYPRFSGVVHEALSQQELCDAVDLTAADPRVQGVGPSIWGTSVARDLSQGITSTMPAGFAELVADREVIFVDWADREAVFAAAVAPAGTKIVIRFHGADGLSVWQYLIDWSKVSDVIFVSEHLKRAVTQILGERLKYTRVHVVSNIIDFEKFNRPKASGAHRNLGMVGWAQRVKDPIWALDVLGILRQHDPSWHITLIGRDFTKNDSRLSERDYGIEFRTRALQDDVVEGIRYVAYTSDLPRYLANVGFAISSSLRESNPVGVMEMLAAGAVPVIRDWPVFSHVGGPSTMFPADWIVRTPEEAAARIADHADESVWHQAAMAARDEAKRRFSSGEVAQRYRDIVLPRN